MFYQTEITLYNSFIASMSADVEEIRQILSGNQISTGESKMKMSDLSKNQVPKTWMKLFPVKGKIH